MHQDDVQDDGETSSTESYPRFTPIPPAPAALKGLLLVRKQENDTAMVKARFKGRRTT